MILIDYLKHDKLVHSISKDKTSSKESGLSGEPGPRVLAAVEQQLGAGSGPVMTLLLVAMACTVLANTIRPWPVVTHRAGYIRPDSDILPDRSRTVTYQILMF